MVLFKKKFERSEFGNVRMGNGSVRLQAVNLNVYAFETDGILIDTGSFTLLEQFKGFFEEVDFEKVVITHAHEDHTGGASYLQQQYGTSIYMNEMSINECMKKANYPFYRKVFWGKRPAFTAEAIGETFESRNASWDVIETPGHSKDHLSFLNCETGQLFTGDLYVTPKTKVILREESIPTIISSLERVLTNDFEEVFCCHAGYVKDGRKALSRKLEYLLEMRDKIQLLREEGLTEKEINEQLFKKYPITRLSLGEWDSKHIVTSVLKNT